eukprot:6474299-Amphidinium_carterae.1
MKAVADLARAWDTMQLYVSNRQSKNAWERILDAVDLPTKRSLEGTKRIMWRPKAASPAAAASAKQQALPLSDKAMAAKKKRKQPQQQQQPQQQTGAKKTAVSAAPVPPVPPPPPPPTDRTEAVREKAMPAKRPSREPSGALQNVVVDGGTIDVDADLGDDDLCGIVDLTPPESQQKILQENQAKMAGLVSKRSPSWTRFGLHERLERRCKQVKTPDSSAPWHIHDGESERAVVSLSYESGTTPWRPDVIRPPPP